MGAAGAVGGAILRMDDEPQFPQKNYSSDDAAPNITRLGIY